MSRAILAVAGGRKTQAIVDECSSGLRERQRLAITYTLTGQAGLSRRLHRACQAGAIPEVMGWYAFLLRHLIRPYIQSFFPGQKVSGLHFEDEEPKRKLKAVGVARYFDRENRAYRCRLSKLALEVIRASNGAAMNRLERIYDELYIDEVQDLAGNDLNILEALLDSRISLVMVGDIRQSVLCTNPSDMKNRRYRGLNKIDWFRLLDADGRCTLEERFTTWRSNQVIASFSDTVLPAKLGFPPTKSMQAKITEHDGVFVVSWGNLLEYLATFNPSCFRQNKLSHTLESHAGTNFGKCKGITCPRVLIYPTDPILHFLLSGARLEEKSAAGLYTAITRAIHSVAFVVKEPRRFAGKFPEWVPSHCVRNGGMHPALFPEEFDF